MKENNTKKYELTNETTETSGKILYRIRALRDFEDVSLGDLGGFIESENNLSHTGNAWVGGDARIYDNATVCGNAQIYGNAQICGNAEVYGDVQIKKGVNNGR